MEILNKEGITDDEIKSFENKVGFYLLLNPKSEIILHPGVFPCKSELRTILVLQA